MSDTTPDQPAKRRRAETIIPPNTIKEKVGSGGLDERIINNAQMAIEKNEADFAPIAIPLLDLLSQSIDSAQAGAKGEPAIEALIYPAMQLKAQGAMFHYPLVSEVCNILVNFLETIKDIDKDVIDICLAHRQSITAALAIKGDGGAVGKELRNALMDACNRYYKSHQT